MLRREWEACVYLEESSEQVVGPPIGRAWENDKGQIHVELDYVPIRGKLTLRPKGTPGHG
jgi:hypothetical protein